MMTDAHSIRLWAAKTSAIQTTLDYREEPVLQSQARLAGRKVLTPVVDLGDYSCRAVIDLVSITFEFARPTQFRHVQKALTALAGRRPHVVPSLPDAGGVAKVFTVTIQEPTLAMARACHELLQGKFGETSEPVVNELEVSVDFTPRTPSDDSRARMVTVLTRHLYPGRDVFKRSTTRPRFSWGSKRSQNNFTLKRSRIKLDDNDLILNSAGDVSPPVDATYYIGHRRAGALWRVMDKVIDRQNRAAGTFVALSEEKKRARVEIRLDRLELRQLGVTGLQDLFALNIAGLQGRFFKFMLPTFIPQRSSMHPADRHWEQERLARFLNVGVVGLRAMDDQRTRERTKHRKSLAGQLRTKGRPMPAKDRIGLGLSGTLVSYRQLNDRVSMALRKLGEREALGMKVEGSGY